MDAFGSARRRSPYINDAHEAASERFPHPRRRAEKGPLGGAPSRSTLRRAHPGRGGAPASDTLVGVGGLDSAGRGRLIALLGHAGEEEG